MINLELSATDQDTFSQVMLVAEHMMRPYSRKYDREEHSYPKELEEASKLIYGNPRASAGKAKASDPDTVKNGSNLMSVTAVEAMCWGDVGLMLAMPGLVIYIFFITMVGKFGLVWMCLVVGVLLIAPYARVARANALAISNREFVTAARSIGTNKARILFREVIPNVYPTLFAYALVSMGVLIILEATLSFLGIGMPIPTSSWGNMIAESRRDLAINPWPCVWPALTLILTVYSINVVADWIRKDMAARTSALS